MFYGKNEVSSANLIFIFYCGTVSRETGKNVGIFLIFWHQKMKLADGFIHETDMKPRAVSFNFFFLTEFGGFIISVSFI